SFERDRRLDGNPVQTAIGNPAGRFAVVLADGEIEIMSWHGQLFATDPELQQSRIDIEHRRPADMDHQRRTDATAELQQQFAPLKGRIPRVARWQNEQSRRAEAGLPKPEPRTPPSGMHLSNWDSGLNWPPGSLP